VGFGGLWVLCYLNLYIIWRVGYFFGHVMGMRKQDIHRTSTRVLECL